jgi:hypothetical protein
LFLGGVWVAVVFLLPCCRAIYRQSSSRDQAGS